MSSVGVWRGMSEVQILWSVQAVQVLPSDVVCISDVGADVPIALPKHNQESP